MFVSITAQEFILNKRKTHTLQKLIDEIVSEAGRLNVDEWELFNMIKTANHKEGRSKT